MRDGTTLPITEWRVVGLSVEGTSHRRTGQPCQDASLWQILPDNRLVIAIADGAGSAAHSEQGAALAVKTALATLSDALIGTVPGDEDAWRSLMDETFQTVRASIVSHAEGTGIALRELATTLTCIAATDDRFVVGQIGDGVAVARDEDDAMFVAIMPQRGEYANEVQLLTSPDAAEKTEIRVFEKTVRAIAVTTDGLLRLAVQLPTYEPHLPFFHPLLAFVAETPDESLAKEELRSFLDSERVCGRTDDDKTLVLAVRVAAIMVDTHADSEPAITQPPGEPTQ